jgi:hypothetical protein
VSRLALGSQELEKEKMTLGWVDASHTPEEGAHSPSWPNGLVIVIIIVGGQWRRLHAGRQGDYWSRPASMGEGKA